MTFMFQTASLACEDLMCAVVAADAFRVKQLINEGANPSRLYSIDSKNPNAPLELPLKRALGMRDETISIILLELGADPMLGNHPHTSLTLATMRGLSKVVFYILDNQLLDINQVTTETKLFNPLDYAVSLGNVELARLLLSFGASPNYTTVDGTVTSLSSALFSGTEHMIPMLISHGADVPKQVNETALQVAAAKSHPGILRLLTRYSPGVLEQFTSVIPAAHMNCRHQERMFEAILSGRQDCWGIDKIDAVLSREREWRKSGATYLSNSALGVFHDHIARCKTVLAASVTESLASLLKPEQAASKTISRDGLDEALISGNEEAVIGYINDEENRCYPGYSLLHRAVDLGRFRVINYLLRHPRRKELICPTSLGLTELHLMVLDLDYDSVEEALVQQGVRSDPVDKLGYSPLFFALALGADDLAQLLVSAGANIYRRTHEGRNALHFAAIGDSALLFTRGSNKVRFDPEKLGVDAIDLVDGRTPLISAMASQCPTQMVQQLLANGADPCLIDKYGKNSVDYHLSVAFDGQFDEGESTRKTRTLPDCSSGEITSVVSKESGSG